MKTLLVAMSCFALGGCTFVMRDLFHVPLPLEEVDARQPHANVKLTMAHHKKVSEHANDMVRFAPLHGGPSGYLPNAGEGTSFFRSPVGDGYWLFETEFFHYETTRTCRTEDGMTKCQDRTVAVRDAKCGAGGDFTLEDGHYYVMDYAFEDHAKCTLVCSEERMVDNVVVSSPCRAPEK